MYICLCNGFTDRQVRQAIAEGASTTGKIFKHLAVQPRCGKCATVVRGMAEEARCGGNCGGCGEKG